MKESINTSPTKNSGKDSDNATTLDEQAQTELGPATTFFSSMSSLRPDGTLNGANRSQVLSLQRTLGNKAVQRMVERTRQARTATNATNLKPGAANTIEPTVKPPEIIGQAANALSHPVQRLMTPDKFKDKSGGPFSGARDKIKKVDAALLKYQSASSRSVGLSEVIAACKDYLDGPGKKDSKRISGVKALRKEATNELAAWRLRERIPLPTSVYRSDERTPEKIAEVGFQPWLPQGNISIIEHVKQVLEEDHPDLATGESGKAGMGAKKHSQFVSTAGDLNFAKDPTLLAGLLNKYFYKINTRTNTQSFHDASISFDEQGIPNPYETQFEFCQEGGIPGNQVSYFVPGSKLMDFILAGTDASSWNVPWEPMPVHV
jgi:hypothetical protein